LPLDKSNIKCRSILGVSTIISVAARFGIDSKSVIEKAKLESANLQDSTVFISKTQVKAMWQEIVDQAKGDERIIFKIAENTPAGVHGILSHVANSSPSVREKLEAIKKYVSLFDKSAEVDITETDSFLTLHVNTKGQEFHCKYDALFLTYILVLRQKEMDVEEKARPRYISLKDHYNISHEELDQAFGCSVLTRQKEALVNYSLEHMDSPRSYSNQSLFDMFTSQASKLLNEISNDHTEESPETLFSSKVKNIVQSKILIARLDKNDIAKYFKLSPRGLQRKLALEGTSYRSICEIVKKDLASKLLNSSVKSIDEIAHILGYNDRPAFNRAFKNWYDQTPASFRDNRHK